MKIYVTHYKCLPDETPVQARQIESKQIFEALAEMLLKLPGRLLKVSEAFHSAVHRISTCYNIWGPSGTLEPSK